MIRKKKAIWKKAIYIIGISFIISSVVIGFMNLSTNPHTVDKYDRVEIDYLVWESDESQSFISTTPEINVTSWIKMIPISENETSGLILGLYNNLIRKRIYFDSGIIWLNKCIDQDRDGIDDSTGELALTYGKSSDSLFNTCLIIRFKVLDIEKDTFIQKLFPEEDTFLHNIFTIFQVTFNIIYSLFPIFLIILFTLLIDYFFRHPIRLKLKIRIDGRRLVRNIFKYGLMLGIVYAIPYIVFGIVNLTLPPEELSLLKTSYDFFIPSIIFLIVISCIGFIVVYLLLFGRINRKIKKRNI